MVALQRNNETILAKRLKENLKNANREEIVLCPPFTSLLSVYEIIKNSPIKLGAQNISSEKEGAYTGEISPSMIKDVGCAVCNYWAF